MVGLSDFFRVKLYDVVEIPISEKHGVTEHGIKNYVDALVSGTGVNQEITYDAITIAHNGDAYPLLLDRGDAMSARQGRYVWDNWDTCYSKCKVRLTVGGVLWSGGDTYIGGPFETKTTLYVWINSVIPNNGSSVTGHARIEVYDEVADVPAIQKIYGYNNLYCACAGGGNSRKSKVKTAFEGGPWLWDMFTSLTTYFTEDGGALTGTILGSTVQAENGNNKKIFWMPANKRNLYGMPKVGNTLNLGGEVPDDFRKWWNENTSTSVNQVIEDEGGHTIVGRAIIIMDRVTQSWSVVNHRSDDIDWFGTSDQQVINVFLIKHWANDGRFAFFIKPLGISDVLIDWFDQSKYRLEAIGFNKDRQMTLKPVPTAENQAGSDFFGDRTVILKSGWSFIDSTGHMENTGFVLPRKVRFRLRRLSDNKVGPLTITGLRPIVRTTAAKLKWVVSPI